MTRASEISPTKSRRVSARDIVVYGSVVASIWLGWEVVKALVVERAPGMVAIQIAPNSPTALQSAGEELLSEGRTGDAQALSQSSLERAPFNARALRVLGLVESRQNNPAGADELLTLAGNWSLRDDPAHAWLIEKRLRDGNYSSAFAHADTLVRRRTDIYPQIFDLFTVAALRDSRALGPLAGLLAADPPWRRAFLAYLNERDDADALQLNLAIAMNNSRKPLANGELQDLYLHWVDERRLGAMRLLRERTGRPQTTHMLQNGDFSKTTDQQIAPFGWRLTNGVGLAVEAIEDDLRSRNLALRITYDGYSSGMVADQLLLLPPGKFELVGEDRFEASSPDARLSWSVVCLESQERIGRWSRQPNEVVVDSKWNPFALMIDVPAMSCTAQWLRLERNPGDRRSTTIAWFDNLSIRATAPASPSSARAS